jgi:hypothetical protein
VPLYTGERRSPVWRFLHRLVLEAFVGPCPPGCVGCHANDDPSDNRLENLRWDTHKANSADAVRNGRYRTGPAHHNSRFTEAQVRAIRRANKDGASVVSLAIITGASETAIRLIVQGKNWAWLSQPAER